MIESAFYLFIITLCSISSLGCMAMLISSIRSDRELRAVKRLAQHVVSRPQNYELRGGRGAGTKMSIMA